MIALHIRGVLLSNYVHDKAYVIAARSLDRFLSRDSSSPCSMYAFFGVAHEQDKLLTSVSSIHEPIQEGSEGPLSLIIGHII